MKRKANIKSPVSTAATEATEAERLFLKCIINLRNTLVLNRIIQRLKKDHNIDINDMSKGEPK